MSSTRKRTLQQRWRVARLRMAKVALSLRHLVVIAYGVIGPRTAVMALGVWWLYTGAAEIYRPAGPIVAGGVLLWISLRRPPPSARLDHFAEELLGAISRVGRS
jgi:hypothetical protein